MRNLRSRLVFAFFAGMAGFAGVGCNAAWGGAWLLPSGYGQLIAYTAFSESTLAFDAHGNLVAVPAYQKFEVGNYLEYGLTDWLTVIAAPAYDRVSTPPPGQSYTGLGESEIAAKVGLYRTDTAVISVQAGLRTPGASFDSLRPLGSPPRCVRRSARHGRAQLRYRRNGGFRRGAGRLSHLCRKAAGRMAHRFDVGTAANAKASHAPAKLYFDIQWPRPVWACVLGQAATESRLRYRPPMVGAGWRISNRRGDQCRTRTRAYRGRLVSVLAPAAGLLA